MTNKKAKGLYEILIETAKRKGVTVLYPSVVIGPNDDRKEIAEGVRAIWGEDGTFRTVECLSVPDLVKLTGAGKLWKLSEDDILELDEFTDGLFVAPPKYKKATDSYFCFWADDNKYPGQRAG